MIRRLIILFKIGRKLAQSEVLNIFSKFHQVPTSIKILFYFLSFSFKKKDEINYNMDKNERLSNRNSS